jgi:hypothetical protein
LPRKSADFIVLDASPLDNFANVCKINQVYLREQEVDRAGWRVKWQAQWRAKSQLYSQTGGQHDYTPYVHQGGRDGNDRRNDIRNFRSTRPRSAGAELSRHRAAEAQSST